MKNNIVLFILINLIIFSQSEANPDEVIHINISNNDIKHITNETVNGSEGSKMNVIYLDSTEDEENNHFIQLLKNLIKDSGKTQAKSFSKSEFINLGEFF